MQTQKTRWLIPAFLVAVILLAGLFFSQKQSPAPESVTSQDQETPVESGGELPQIGDADPLEGDEKNVVLSSDGKSSYRVKAGTQKGKPARSAADQPLRMEIDWEDEFVSLDVLKSALAGNESDVIAVSDLITQCRGISPEIKSLESQLNGMSKHVKDGNPLPTLLIPGTGENLKFSNFLEFEEFQLTRFAQCQATRRLFGDDMRKRLEEEAKNGSVTARFLYAMWLPEQRQSNQANLIEWITYQGLAWDFTWANIREGEPLGLLAYGRSLEHSGSPYFTPRHYNYGPAFILASKKCGLESPTVDQKVGNLTSYWTEKNMTNRLNQAESLSDQIVDMFCR